MMVLAIISYKWILIAAVLVLMLIIGYIADATDFGHKKFGKAKPKDNPNEVKEVEDVVENKTIEDVNILNEDLNVPFGDVQVDSFSKLPEENYPNEDLTIPLENVELPTNEEKEVEEAAEETVEEATPIEEVAEETVEEATPIEEATPTEEVTEPLVEEIKEDEEVKEEPKKKKEKKKSKKSLEDAKTNYEEKIVPEFITEQFGDDSFVSSDDDIWKF